MNKSDIIKDIIHKKIFQEFGLLKYIVQIDDINLSRNGYDLLFRLTNNTLKFRFVFSSESDGDLFYYVDDEIKICLTSKNCANLKELIQFNVRILSKLEDDVDKLALNLETKLMICKLIDENKYHIPELERIKIVTSISNDVGKLDGFNQSKRSNEILNKYSKHT